MLTKPSFIKRIIVAVVTIGSIGTGIAVPLTTAAAPAARAPLTCTATLAVTAAD
jgi:hypothetical protein